MIYWSCLPQFPTTEQIRAVRYPVKVKTNAIFRCSSLASPFEGKSFCIGYARIGTSPSSTIARVISAALPQKLSRETVSVISMPVIKMGGTVNILTLLASKFPKVIFFVTIFSFILSTSFSFVLLLI